MKPLWEGPESDGRNGGITFSMLKRFLDCPHRYYVKYVLGLSPTEKFSRVMEYGNLWHVCEEALAADPGGSLKYNGRPSWAEKLDAYAEKLYHQFPMQREEIAHWVGVCKVQFPVYVDYWAKQGDVLARTPLLQEATFRVPYKLPSGRTVYLRGKFDSVDAIGGRGIYIAENKTKGEIDEAALVRQLTFDLQVMIYLTALHNLPSQEFWQAAREACPGAGRRPPILGVRYNVVRRPLSGGRGSIRPRAATKTKPAESLDEFLDRLRGLIDGTGGEDAPGPAYYFMRWKVEVPKGTVDRFRQQCLDPLLERLCDWYRWVSTDAQPFAAPHGLHYRHPFGAANSVDEYGATDIDSFMDTGNEVGLRRRSRLFEELD